MIIQDYLFYYISCIYQIYVYKPQRDSIFKDYATEYRKQIKGSQGELRLSKKEMRQMRELEGSFFSRTNQGL